MHQIDIVRAWKDEEYRASLSAEELAALPANPVGMIELGDEELAAASGAEYEPSDPCPSVNTAECCYPATAVSWCYCPPPPETANSWCYCPSDGHCGSYNPVVC